jgi:signal transduction histidine kinase/CheY-like chemotaxis protein
MDTRKNLPAKTAILILSMVFIMSLITMVALNYSRQTSAFWDYQFDRLITITERYTNRLEDFVKVLSNTLENMSNEVSLGILKTRKDYENYLALSIRPSGDFLSGYIALDNGELYLCGPLPPGPVEKDPNFDYWYEYGKTVAGAIFTEPYPDPITGQIVVSCLMGVSDHNGVRGVIGLYMSLDRLKALLEGASPSKNGGVYISSASGKIIIARDPRFMPRIENGQIQFTTIAGLRSGVEVLKSVPASPDHHIVITTARDSEGKIKYETMTKVPGTDWSMGFSLYADDHKQELWNIFKFQMPIILLSVLMSGTGIIIAVILINYSMERASLKENIAQAESASKTKSEFLSRMSHEMRTPLNAIIGMTKIADAASDVHKLRYCLSTIETSSTQLLSIINDILDMSKIEAGKFTLEEAPVNLEKVLMKISNLIIDKAEQEKQQFTIRIDKDMGIHYLGDELRLSQVITNLLSNAVKFTPQGGRITLAVHEAGHEDGKVRLRFSVSDTGIGMSAEQISRLFRSFEQADGSISRRFGGTGLGLAISKNIVEKMGGRIWVESRQKQGSSFFFEVLLVPAPGKNKPVIFDAIRASELITLVIDADRENREHIVSLLEHMGIAAREANNGRSASELVTRAREKGKPYDLIFLDEKLPDMDSLDFARRFSGDTIVLMATFLDWNKIEPEAKDAGITRLILKPIFPSSLLDMISEITGRLAKRIEQPDHRETPKPDFSGIRLLLAEDIEINQEIFISLLEDTHIQIDTVKNGMDAVKMFTKDPCLYDIIIMDIQMPGMDGYEATRKIREFEARRSTDAAGTNGTGQSPVPIIAMTANAFKEDIDNCLKSGMNGHLAKPIDIDAVIAAISGHVKKSRP